MNLLKSKKLLVGLMMLACSTFITGCGGSEDKSASGTDVDSYPNKPITMIVTHAAGGDTDYNARLLARLLEEELGQPVVPNNVTGANGSIALEQYKDGDTDGYTIIATNTAALSGNEATGLSDFSYKDFEPVALYGKQAGENIVVRADSPYNNIQELIDASKANPNQLKFGVSMGGGVYVASVILDKEAGAKFTVVDTGDAANRLTALLGGHIDATSIPYSTAKEYIESGQLKTLGSLLSERPSMLPDIPTANETVKDLSVDTLYVVLAPKGTDPAVVEKLNKAIANVVNNNKEYKENVEKMNFQSPWVLSVQDTIKELDAQREHFMEYKEFLQ